MKFYWDEISIQLQFPCQLSILFLIDYKNFIIKLLIALICCLIMSFRSSTRFFRSPHIWGFAIGSLIGLVSLEIILHYNQENNPLPEPADVEKRRKLVTREPRAAIAVIQPSCPVYGNITGIVRLTQQNKESKTKIDARIDGLKDGKHGFNICSSGDLSRGCASTGKHFNPLSKHHGDFKNLERHVGDLG